MIFRVCVLLTLLIVMFPALAFSQVGTAYFSSPINWSQTPDLYFTVTNGPVSMCGDFLSTRNGYANYNSGQVCTDANGSLTAGPWTWNNTAADQTDTDVRIHWANNTYTYFTSSHIWDKTCPTVSVSTATPGSFTGLATDNQWGAGFDPQWTYAEALFMDTTGTTTPYYTPPLYWDGTAYRAFSSVSISATVSGMPSHGVTWSVPVPPSSAHISGHTYQWEIHFADGDTRNCMPQIVRMTFTY